MATVLPDDPTKVFGRRVGAAVIDGVIVAVPTFIVVSSEFEYIELGSTDAASEFCDTFNDSFESGICVNADNTAYFNDDFSPAPFLVGLGGGLLLFVLLQGLLGWTVGKLLTGIRTVQADGSKPGLGRALVRWLCLLLVDSQPCGIPLVGFITGLTSTGHRRVGDMVAKTYVVRKSAAGSPIAVPGVSVAPGAPLAPTAYAPPPSGTPWGAAPSSTETATHPAPTAKPGPQWDAARNTYIQWDPEAKLWMQWDETGQAWLPIPNQ
jgi:uncharacterized RDD family membrane protein YckC